MISNKQCELGRTMTNDNTSDMQINKEYLNMDETTKITAAQCVDAAMKLHDAPIDKNFAIMCDDFKIIAKTFEIHPATLFCIYMKHHPK